MDVLLLPILHTIYGPFLWLLTPHYLTTARLFVSLAAALTFALVTYGWCNTAALLLVLSNFLDHTDGE